jgi:hypothetical protein
MSLYHLIVIVGSCGPEVAEPLSGFLSSLGIGQRYLIKSPDSTPAEIIARADAEGGVPIVTIWNERTRSAPFLEELLHADTLPGRAHFLIVPSDMVSTIVAEQLEQSASYDPEHPRVLVLSLQDLTLATVREMVRLHLSHSCASYLGRPQQARRIAPAPITALSIAERNVNDIDRRVMQRGMFYVQLLRIPRF